MMALTGRSDLLVGISVEVTAATKNWLELSAKFGNPIAMNAVAQDLLSKGQVAEAGWFIKCKRALNPIRHN